MIRVKVGTVEVRTDADLTFKQLERLLAMVAGTAAALTPDDPEPGPLIGFSAPVLERLPDDNWPGETPE